MKRLVMIMVLGALGVVSATAFAGTSLNGRSINGTRINGSSLNGTRINGSSLNGRVANGGRYNGRALNGVTANAPAELVLKGVRADRGLLTR